VGQFLTRDPLEQQTGQAYAYAGGDPVNNSDPSGQAYDRFGCATGDLRRETAEATFVYNALEYGGRGACNVAVPGIPGSAVETVVSIQNNEQTAELWVVRPLEDLLPTGYAEAEARAQQEVAALRRARQACQLYAGLSNGSPLSRQGVDVSTLQPGLGFNGARGIVLVEQGPAGNALNPPAQVELGQFISPTGAVPGVLFYQGYTPVPGHSCIASNFSFLGALHCGYQFLVGDDLDALRSNRVGFLGKAVAVVDLASNVLLLAPFVGTDARGAIKATAAGILRTALRRAVSEGELRTLDELGGHAGAQLGEGEYQQLDQGARQGEGQERPVDTGGGCGCFVAGTRVATPGGSVAIERLRKGMRVLAENPATGKVEAEPVVRLITDQVSPLLAVELSDGTTLKVTADHPFWVDSGDHLAHSGWLHAEHLRPGDRLRTAKGKDAVVVRVRRNAGHAVVYTLTVAYDHTFFVGSARVLVHNCDINIEPRGNGEYVGRIPGDPNAFFRIIVEGKGVAVTDVFRSNQAKGSAGTILADFLRKVGLPQPAFIRLENVINVPTAEALGRGEDFNKTVLGRTTQTTVSSLGGRITGSRVFTDYRGKLNIEVSVSY